MKAPPRPKQARSQRTRDTIIAAAAGALVELGYQKASTPAIAAKAGVSQGALYKHFPEKPQLLAACIERILATFVTDFRAGIATQRSPRAGLPDRVAHAVTALWAIFRRPEMQAVFEVYVAARTDRALGRALSPIIDRHRANILDAAVLVFPEVAAVPDFPSVVDAVVYAMQGVVLGIFAPEESEAAAEAAHLAFFQRLASRELEAALARHRKGAVR